MSARHAHAELRQSAQVEPSAPIASFFFAYVLMMAAAFFVLRQGFATTRGTGINVDRAIFMVINAASLSGFQLSVTPHEYKWPGQLTMLVLTVGGSLFTMIVGSAAVARIVALPYSFRQVAAAAVVLEALALLVGTMLLARPGLGIFAAVMQAAAAFGNSGVYFGHLPGVLDWRTHLALLPLAVVGGLGLAVVLNVVQWLRRREPLVMHSRLVITITAALYVLGAVLIILVEWTALPPEARTGEMTMQQVATASAAALNARTLGMPWNWLASFARATQWIVLLLMVIGASPGGTGGGIKTTAVAALFIGARRALAGQPAGRTTGFALIWAGLYALVVAAALMVLLQTQAEMEPDRLLFLCVSAASNVGLSHDAVTLVGSGLYTLSFVMLFGRLAPLLILWWMASNAQREDMAIG